MHLSSDELILWQHGFFKINVTIATTWVLMFVLVVGARLVTRNLTSDVHISRWQSLLEVIVVTIRKQIEEVGLRHPQRYMGFLGTLFLFIALSNLCTIFPAYEPPTGSLSTTAALALSVFVAVPLFGIAESGLAAYLRSYARPTLLMLPFNLIGELSRTLAMAIRLFGNIMSGTMILAILLTVTPFIFPVVMSLLGLLTGMVQAYIFSILSAVYITAATRASARGGGGMNTRNAMRQLNPTKGNIMDSTTLIAVASIVTAGLTIAIGGIGPALGEGRAVSTALSSLAQQPDAATTITRTLFVGLAMIESIAIYCFVVAMILIFANPFWNTVIAQAAAK